MIFFLNFNNSNRNKYHESVRFDANAQLKFVRIIESDI